MNHINNSISNSIVNSTNLLVGDGVIIAEMAVLEVAVTADEKATKPLNGSGFCLKGSFPHDRLEAIVWEFEERMPQKATVGRALDLAELLFGGEPLAMLTELFEAFLVIGFPIEAELVCRNCFASF